MKRSSILLVALLGLLMGFSYVGQAAEPEIFYTGGTFDAGGATFRLGNWGGFWKEQWMEKFIPEFEKDFNCKVSYDGGWPWFPKYVAGGERNPPHAVSNWNLFQMSKAANAGDFFVDIEEIKANIPNADQIWDFAWLSGTGVTWGFGEHCFVYRKDLVEEPHPKEFADFWEDRFDGMRASYITSNGLFPPLWMTAAQVFGEGPHDVATMEKAMKDSMPMKIVDFTGTMQMLLEKGEVVIGEQWDGELYTMLEAGLPLEVVWWPKGYRAILSQTFTVSKHVSALEKKLAYAFINRALSARWQYELAEVSLGLRSTNKYVRVPEKLAKWGVKNTAEAVAEIWVPEYTWYRENEDEIVRMAESIFAGH